VDEMKVSENYKVRDKVLKVLKGERFPPKTFSVTKLVGCPRRTYYRMKGAYEIASDSRTLIFARGRGLHNELERAFTNREIRKMVDGIRGDIDAADENIIEIYSTNMSSSRVEDINKVPEVFGNKVKQLMAYCYICAKSSGDLLVYFMSGDYTRFTEIAGKLVYTGIRPELMCWTLEFTESEIKENWERMLVNKAEIEHALKTGIPPLIVGEEWECGFCGFNHICYSEELVTESGDASKVVTEGQRGDIK